MRTLRIIAFVLVAVSLAACNQVLGVEGLTTEDAAGSPLPPASLELAVQGGPTYVQIGSTFVLDVQVQRGAAVTGPVTVSVPAMVEGVTFEPATIASGEFAGRITGHVAPTAKFGLVSFRLRAEAPDGVTAEDDGGATVVGIPGTPDDSFGPFATRTIDTFQYTTAAFRQGDRIIFLAGDSVHRLELSGELDKTFGVDGVAKAPAGAGGLISPRIQDIVLDASGRVLAAVEGLREAGNLDSRASLVVRFTRDGTVDQSYPSRLLDDGYGVQILQIALARDGGMFIRGIADRHFMWRTFEDSRSDSTFMARFDRTLDVKGCPVVLDDGSVLLTLRAAEDGILRLRPSGRVDETYGVNGTLTMPPASSDWCIFGDTERAVTRMHDGKVLLAGTSGHDTPTLWRLGKDGKLDSTFGSGGYALGVSIGVDTVTEQLLETHEAPDGTIHAVGFADNSNDHERVTMMRFSKDGVVDRAFGDRGLFVDSLQWSVESTLFWDDHRVYVFGWTDENRNKVTIKRFWY